MTITRPITTFYTGTYTVTRTTATTAGTTGIVVAGTASTFTIDASIQPVMDGRALESLADLSRGAEVALVLTTTAIDPITPTQAPDVITVSGEAWTVIKAEHWNARGKTWTRAYIARKARP